MRCASVYVSVCVSGSLSLSLSMCPSVRPLRVKPKTQSSQPTTHDDDETISQSTTNNQSHLSIIAFSRVVASLPGPVPEGVEVFKALASGELFCHKASAAALFPTLYAKAADDEQR